MELANRIWATLLVIITVQGSNVAFGARCVFQSQDIGKITGVGTDSLAAFADAAEQCYDLRVAQFKKLRANQLDEERGLAFIDSCINIECQTQKE